MRGNVYTMSDLFKQLGLPSEPAAIEDFIARHEGACVDCTVSKVAKTGFSPSFLPSANTVKSPKRISGT